MRFLYLIFFLSISIFCQGQLNIPCNNWLNLPSYQSYVSVGDLDVPGNKITLEAIFVRTAPYTTGFNWAGDLISKHVDPSDVNYLLRPNNAEITTSNGYFSTPAICEIELNKTYHAAMVYDGITLKFYRNGFLMSSVPAAGNMFQNNHQTRIGLYDGLLHNTNLVGYINEVRIWNVARTQAEIRTYMNSSLSNPTTQTGLLAYYTFDNLLNKQGNTSWNGTPGGSASINGSIPSCSFFADSCSSRANIGNIINDYTPVISFAPCENKIIVEDASTFNTGDTVLLIQMKGAIIDSTNTASFGNITDYRNAGNYEINYVKSKSGNTIELKNKLIRQYDIPLGKVQLIRVPYYQNANVVATLTCLPWDGSKGGVLVLNVFDSITLNADIDVKGKGFRGGIISNNPDGTCGAGSPNYFYSLTQFVGGAGGAEKGEGISLLSNDKMAGKGPLGNGGGGGNKHNTGGAGGGNYGKGGKGGNELAGCSVAVNGGIGGSSLTIGYANNKIFMGGGGGRGDDNNGFGTVGETGGGIVIINARALNGNNKLINAGGNSQLIAGAGNGDGAGGGGAGGSVLLNVNSHNNPLSIDVTGGKGGNQNPPLWGCVGPGGGGGGGMVYFKSASQPSSATVAAIGGTAGIYQSVGYSCTNTTYGAANGDNGGVLVNLQLPISNTLFTPNIDSVRISNSGSGCNKIDVSGLGYTNTNPITSWQWYFGDGGTAVTQNSSHTYSSSGSYPVKLVVTDINGCKDSITKNISVFCNNAGIGNIINDYTPVLSLLPCENKIAVEDASAFNTGDTVLMIQMKGALIDSTNTASFGTITDYRHAGNYEINYVKSKTGNVIELKNIITRQYNLPDGKVQLIRVPYYTNADVSSTLTCLPWDGSKGGVLVLNARDTITLNANIDVSGRGFRGGIDPFSNPPSFYCYENQFYYPVAPDLASGKGEAIAEVLPNKSFGKGAIANGGGSGNSHNSGGGGGSNVGAGGMGGYNFESGDCTANVPFDNRGLGGKALSYTNASNKIFLGGGGGAGHSNNPQAFESTGGNGSGIVIIITDKIKNNGNKIIANGNAGTPCGNTGAECHEGMGGGGGGGTVLIKTNTILDNIAVEAKGGNGADMVAAGFLKVGPGGGGGSGIVWFSNPSTPPGMSFVANGGPNGVCTGYSNNAWGATVGQAGTALLNLSIPVDNTPFRPNIDSVRIKDTLNSCDNFNFGGFGYTNTNPIASWQWYFGDGGTATTQNTNHTYAPGTYTVKLVVTDINGCKDSITKNITASILTMDAGPADTICSANSTVLQATATGATQYTWTPAAFLNNASILNPTATPPVTTMFYLTATNANGCTITDSALVTVRSATGFTISPSADICTNNSIQLTATGGDVYAWLPSQSLDNPSIFNPTATPGSTTTYSVLITDTVCNNVGNLSTTITVLAPPVITASRSNDIDCSTPQSQLSATGGVEYLWSPAATLSNPAIANPIAAPLVTTLYTVIGKSSAGCQNQDTVTVKVSQVNKGGYLMPTAFTPNNDGLNDCYGIKYWGTVTEIEFSIYNRWGERIFYTTNPGACWDGTYKGVRQDAAVFVYMIKAKTSCEPTVFRKGTFALIR